MWKTLLLGTALLTAVPAQAGWNEARSKHFVVYADEPEPELKAFAEKLERFDAAVREARGVPDVQPGRSTQVTLYVLKNIEALRKVYGDEDTAVAGFYLPKASGSVAFVPEEGRPGKWGLSGQTIFFHEYTHHLMLQDADQPLPTWLTEGFAEFFANPEFKPDGSVVIGRPPLYRGEALYTIERIPLEKMISGDYLYVTGREYDSIYGRGWLLTHLLAFDLKRRGQQTRFLDEIAKGVPAKQAAQNAFGDLKALDKELDRYFKNDTWTLATIPAAKLKIPPVTVRPLSAGEAQLMEAKIRLARGGSPAKLKSLVAKARATAQQNPTDENVQTILAQVELAAGNPAEALAAADSALAKNPQSFDALMTRGKALLKIGEKNKASGNWNGARQAFLDANKIDPEAGEPLVLYYRSYVTQGIAPTKNAVDGLSYAVILAPQDNELRMELIGRLIEDNRLDAARTIIGPVAYSPHRGKWHDAAVAILEQLNARNQGQAKAKWQAAQKYFSSED